MTLPLKQVHLQPGFESIFNLFMIISNFESESHCHGHCENPFVASAIVCTLQEYTDRFLLKCRLPCQSMPAHSKICGMPRDLHYRSRKPVHKTTLNLGILSCFASKPAYKHKSCKICLVYIGSGPEQAAAADSSCLGVGDGVATHALCVGRGLG